MAWVLVLALVAFGANGNPAAAAKTAVEPDVSVAYHVAEIAEVITAPVVVAKKQAVGEEIDLSGLFNLTKEVRPSYLALAIRYIKSPRNSAHDVLWTITNWDSQKIRRAMPRKIYNELTGLMENLQDLPMEEIVGLINYIKNSKKTPVKLTKLFYPAG